MEAPFGGFNRVKVRVKKAAIQVLTSLSPSSPPTRGGELGLFTSLLALGLKFIKKRLFRFQDLQEG